MSAGAGLAGDDGPRGASAGSAGTTPYALRWRLRGGLRRYERAEVLALPPERCGVYALWLPSTALPGERECLYVGKSETCVRRRLLDHLGADERNPALRRALRDLGGLAEFSVAWTAGAEETDALETSVIRAWRPLANRNKR